MTQKMLTEPCSTDTYLTEAPESALQIELKPWPELQSYLRPLNPGELKGLKYSIDTYGMQSPIWVLRDGRIVDGLHRWEILLENVPPIALIDNVHFKVLDMDEDSAFKLGVCVNANRRHMSLEDIEILSQKLKRDPRRKQIASALLASGMKQKEVAMQMGCATRTLRRWVQEEPGTDTADEIGWQESPNPSGLIGSTESGQCPLSVDLNVPSVVKGTNSSKCVSEAVDASKDIVFNVEYRSRFSVVVLDLPWPLVRYSWGDFVGNQPSVRSLEYQTMTIEDLKSIPIPSLYHPDGCDVFLWIVNRFEDEAKEIFRQWGVKYQDRLIWHKSGGMFKRNGYLTNNYEIVLWGKVGNPKRRDTSGLEGCFYDKRANGHSRKPKKFYQMIARCFHGPRLDVFSREKHPGFEQWGNQTDFYDGESLPMFSNLPFRLLRSGCFSHDEIAEFSRTPLVSGRHFSTEQLEAYRRVCESADLQNETAVGYALECVAALLNR